MSVRQLAGPFNTTTVGALPDAVIEINPTMWLPGIGMLAMGPIGGRYAYSAGIMTLDGLFCDRGNEVLSNPAYWPAERRLVRTPSFYPYDDTSEFTYEPITFARERTGPLLPKIEGHALANRRYIKLADRALIFQPDYAGWEGYINPFKIVVNGAIVGSEGPPGPIGHGDVMPGRTETEIFVSSTGWETPPLSRGRFYNTETQVWASPVFYWSKRFYSLLYATDYDVFVSMENWVSTPELQGKSNQICIWSLEVDPTIVGPVELLQGQIKSGQIVTYRTQVLGDRNDPAEGELLDWTLTGDGTLLTMQSRTDAQGYATAQVQYGVGESGTSVVEASLKC